MIAAHMCRYRVLVTCSIYQELPDLFRQQLQLHFQLFRLQEGYFASRQLIPDVELTRLQKLLYLRRHVLLLVKLLSNMNMILLMA